ncbi:MAG: hypothetical protein ACYC28_14350 [Longimicrobiales bacterium]
MARPNTPRSQAGGAGILDEQRTAAMRALQSAALACDVAAERVRECAMEEEAAHLRQLGAHLIVLYDRVRIEPAPPSEIDALYAAIGNVRREHRDALRRILRERTGN